MKVDKQGNLYCTGPGGVWIFTPEGKHLGTIQPEEIPANVAWGDEDGKNALHDRANRPLPNQVER